MPQSYIGQAAANYVLHWMHGKTLQQVAFSHVSQPECALTMSKDGIAHSFQKHNIGITCSFLASYNTLPAWCAEYLSLISTSKEEGIGKGCSTPA